VEIGRVEKQRRVMFVMGGIDPISRTTFRDAYQLDLSLLNDAELSHDHLPCVVANPIAALPSATSSTGVSHR
jgi:hypothetical protein